MLLSAALLGQSSFFWCSIMGQWIWVIKDLGVLIWWKRNWKKKRVLQKRKWKKKHAILKITLINKTRQKEPHPFHPPYIYQNLHSKCIWQTWKIFVNTQNIITEVTNNVVIPLLSVSQKKNLPPPSILSWSWLWNWWQWMKIKDVLFVSSWGECP